MYCVIYVNDKLYVGDIADKDETRYLVSVADRYHNHADYDFWDDGDGDTNGKDYPPSDYFQVPRFLVWKGIDQVTLYKTKEECEQHIQRLTIFI